MSVFREDFQPYDPSTSIDWTTRGWSGYLTTGSYTTGSLRMRGGIGDSPCWACNPNSAPYLTLANETEGTFRAHIGVWKEEWVGSGGFSWHVATISDGGLTAVDRFQVHVYLDVDASPAPTDGSQGRIRITATDGASVIDNLTAVATFPADGVFRALQVTWEIAGSHLYVKVYIGDVLVGDFDLAGVSYVNDYATRFQLWETSNGAFSPGAQFYKVVDKLEYEDAANAISWPNLPAPLISLDFCSRGLSSTKRWPVLLSDDGVHGETFLFFEGEYLGNGPVLRYDFDGNLVKAYSYDPARFPLGMMGLAAALDTNACLSNELDDDGLGMIWLAGHHSPDVGVVQPGVLPIRLTTGEVLEPVVAIPAEGESDLGAGFTTLEYPSGNGDPKDQGLPPKPTVVCNEQTNLRTPTPNPGCNSGGRGWVPQYTGPSGVVPIGSDPTNEEPLTGKTDIQPWFEIAHTRYKADGTEEADLLRYGYVDPGADAHIEPRVGSGGSIEIAASDAQGNMKSTSAAVVIDDEPGRPIAIRRADPEYRNFNRDEMTIKALSDAGRRAGLNPRYLGRVLLYGDSCGTPRTAKLNGVDHLFIEGGSFSPDKTAPQFRYPLSFYTSAPPDLAGRFIPYLYGEKSDEGAINPQTGLVNARGLCPVTFVGMDTTLGEEWGRVNFLLYANKAVIGFYGSDCGGLGSFGEGAVSDGKTPSTITLTGTTNLTAVPSGGWAQLVLFHPQHGRSEHRITRVNVAANSVKVDGQILASALAAGIPWFIERIDHIARRVKIDIAARQGVDVMIPGYAGYVRPTPYEDISCAEGEFRMFDGWVRGVLLAEHLSGGPTLAANLAGIEDQGDGSGALITDYFTAYAHWWDNQVHRQVSTPPIDGLWPGSIVGLPEYATSGTTFGLATLTGGATIVQDAGAGIGNDDQTAAIPLPFTFPFFGVDYNELFIYSNGAVSFQEDQDPSLYSQDEPFPTTDQVVNVIMGGFGAYELGTSGTIKYETLGSAPNRRFVIEWRDCPNYDDNLLLSTQQIILHEDGRIEFQTAAQRAATSDTYPWTQGVQNAAGDTFFGLANRNNQDDPAFDLINTGTLFTPAAGDAAELPSWSDGLTKTMHSSFALAQAQSAASLGGNGLQVSAYFSEGISLRDAAQLWNDNGGCWTVVEEHGRVKVFLIDKYADTSTWPRIDDVNRVFGSIDTPRAVDEMMNPVRGGCDWDPDAGEFREDNLTAFSAEAKRRNKGYEKPSKHIDGKLLAFPNQFQWVLNRKSAIHQDGPIYVPVRECDFGLVDYPIGSGVVFTSEEGPGENGYVEHPLVILDRVVDLDGKTCGMVFLDVGTDNLVKPEARRFIATNNDAIAPIATNDATLAPLAAA